jgi:hypothetical protein
LSAGKVNCSAIDGDNEGGNERGNGEKFHDDAEKVIKMRELVRIMGESRREWNSNGSRQADMVGFIYARRNQGRSGEIHEKIHVPS